MLNKEKILAVIPAAGRGSRLGLNTPKALIRPDGKRTLIEMMHEKVTDLVDQVVYVINPTMLIHEDWPKLGEIETVVQEEPTGMGDAIFCAADLIADSSVIVVVWADQYGISQGTLQRALLKHKSRNSNSPKFTIPLIEVENPYVEYNFSGRSIKSISQKREGDKTSESGLTDVGCFILDAGQPLLEARRSHLSEINTGELTHERNFLPFLAWLSIHDWELEIVEAKPSDRAGINTIEDFKSAQRDYGSNE
jgi:bifunctional UDP-N-acetylglucosamine pyrophosphorylase/glucosamine-1-phosphate N-acetyltransferase